MGRFVFLLLILLTLIGCGGGGGSKDGGSSFDGSFPSDNYSGTAYSMWDYVVPSTNTGGSSISSRSLGSTYNATFRSLDSDTIVETPQNTNGEKVIYKRYSDRINVSFYKDDNKTFSYDLKKSVHFQEPTTVKDSACMLVNHFNNLYKNGMTYYDVIEIDCGKYKGFYAKGKGEIAKE